jgi:hypothetical protein
MASTIEEIKIRIDKDSFFIMPALLVVSKKVLKRYQVPHIGITH